MGFISELIGYPLGWIMYAIYALVKNYGLAIFIFTIIIRLIQIPMSVKQQKSTAAMAAFQPKLEKLKVQYAKNPNKLQEEQMKLYAEEGINPMASCGPLIFTMIFLYGVFDVVYRPLYHILRMSKETIEYLKAAAAPLFEGNSYFSQRPELYIIQAVKNNPDAFTGKEGITADIIQKITEFDNMLFGFIDLGAIPNTVFNEGTVWTAGAVGLMLIPVISGLIQLVMSVYSTAKQKRLNPDTANQMAGMNMMLYIMPIFSVMIAFSCPAGLGFYWICSSVVAFIQTIILNKIYTPEYVAKLVEKDKIKNKNKKKSGFAAKYQEMLEEQIKNNAANGAGGRPAGSARNKEPSEEIKLSNAKMKEYERKIIAEARRRQVEKFGGEYSEDE